MHEKQGSKLMCNETVESFVVVQQSWNCEQAGFLLTTAHEPVIMHV